MKMIELKKKIQQKYNIIVFYITLQIKHNDLKNCNNKLY